MLSFMLNLKVEKEAVEKAINTLTAIDIQANTHEGCMGFMWFQHLESPTAFTLIEQWRDQATLDAHISKILDLWNGLVPNLSGAPISTKLVKLVQKS